MKNKNLEEIILKNLQLVKNIAIKIHSTLPKNIELDDLINTGILGLIDATKKYDESFGIKFESYASIRIRGAILDELRKMDWLPRSAREKKKEIENAYLELEKRDGKPPSEEEVAEYLGIELEKLRELLFRFRGNKVGSFFPSGEKDESGEELLLYYLEDDRDDSPEARVTFSELKNVLKKAISELPDREKLLISLYYYDDLNQKEIGEVMGITESRVSQLRSQTIMRLRAKIKEFFSVSKKGG